MIFGDFSRRLAKNKMAMAGLLVVMILFVVAIGAKLSGAVPAG